MTQTVLLGIKEPSARKTLGALLSSAGHLVRDVGTLEEALAAATSLPLPAAAVVETWLLGGAGAPGVTRLLLATPALAVLAVFHPSEHERAVEALRAGAADALLSPVHGDELLLRIGRVLREGPGDSDAARRVVELQRLLAESGLELDKARDARAALEGTLMRLAVADPLTGLFNRRVFDEKLHWEHNRARRFSRPLTLVALDVDHADRIERHFGGEALGEVLKQIGQYLREGLRETDIAARVDDDEFAVLLPETSLPGAREVANGLRRVFGSTGYPNAGRVTVSIGVAALDPAAHPDATSLWGAAQERLRAAKNGGRDRVES